MAIENTSGESFSTASTRAKSRAAPLVAALFFAVLSHAAFLSLPGPALGKPPQVIITADSDLRFGTLMVFGSGSRTVSPAGLVRDVAVVGMEGSQTGPARFTISYDRGNENKHVLDIELDLVMSSPPRVRVQGLEGQLSALETDLPGAGRITPGQPIRITMRDCRERVCSLQFNVGGRLDIVRQYGGADLTVPIPLDVTVISAERQRR